MLGVQTFAIEAAGEIGQIGLPQMAVGDNQSRIATGLAAVQCHLPHPRCIAFAALDRGVELDMFINAEVPGIIAQVIEYLVMAWIMRMVWHGVIGVAGDFSR